VRANLIIGVQICFQGGIQMALRINTNIGSMKAQRNLGVNQSALAKTLERLSSGLRINRAADDAAGLAISEKMRTQIRGFSQAIANAQDGVNLIATAEGAIDTSSQIMQRMRELAIQSANDTLTQSDRSKIQEEVNQLRLELTRIGDTTEFNTRRLLNGSIAASTIGEDATLDLEQNVRVGDTAATVPNIVDFVTSSTVQLTLAAGFQQASMDVAFQIKFVSYQTNSSSPVSVGVELRSSLDGLIAFISLQDFASGSAPTELALTMYGSTSGGSAFGFVAGTIGINTTAIDTVSLGDIGKTALVQITARREAVTTDSALTFHVGPNEGQFVRMGVDDIRAAALRLESLTLLGTNDEDSRLNAQNAIGALDQAIDHVNTVRARLGAFQNRVEFTISNLSIGKENITAAESRIRDTDMASETANLTRSQILIQAGTAVLSQANFAPQAVLSLLG
jgi:flagellin